MNYPKAAVKPYSFQCAGHTLEDPYAWIEKNDEETRAFVARQNDFTTEWFSALGGMQKRVRELAEKANMPSYSGITECHGKLYACRVSPDGKTAAVMLDTGFNLIKVLMDDEMSGDDFHVYEASPCPCDEDIVALFILKNGAARPSVMVRRVSTGETIALLDGMFSYAWSPDGSRIYYSDATVDTELGVNHNSVRAYNIASGKTDLLYEEKDSAVFIMLSVAYTGELFIHVLLSYVNARVLHYAPDTGAVTLMTPNDDSVWQHVGSIGGAHYFFTNESAPRGRVVSLAGSLSLKDAAPVLPEDTRSLEGALVARDRLLAVYLNNAASEAEIYDSKGTKLNDMLLPDKIGTLQLSAGRSQKLLNDAEYLYLNYESFVCPPSVLRCSLESGHTNVAYSQRGTAKREDITVKSHPVTARDGTQVLAFMVYKNGTEKNGKLPTLMYGYGGYNASLTPCYTAPFIGLDVVDWVDRGGLYVQCVLRGGGEYGAEWHEAGWRGNKKNAFYDFIDITEWLISEGWTCPEKIAINGGSNGGLLVTALATLRPDLFAAVLASVPHTDMIRFCWDDRGPMYTTEYGDPRDESMFEYMLSYSPYHNIKEGVEYPAIYVQTGEFDNNVPPYHGKKFAAKMQATGGGAPCLLRVLARGSHGLGTGDDYFNTSAEMQLFAEHILGI